MEAKRTQVNGWPGHRRSWLGLLALPAVLAAGEASAESGAATAHPVLLTFGALLAGLALLYLVAALLLARRFTTAAGRSDDPADVRDRLPSLVPVRFPSRDGLAISGWYVRASVPAGAVVLVHGLGGRKGLELEADLLSLVTELVASGLSVLTIDLRGHGHSDPARLSYGWHERLDVLGAVDWLLDAGYRRGRIGVLGASMGGAAAVAAAAEDTAIGAVVSDCTFADFGAVLRCRFPRALPFGIGRLLLPGTIEAARLFIGVRMDAFRPAELARRLRDRAVLVIHSGDDPFIPVQHGRDLAAAANGTLWVTDVRRHVGSYAHDPEAYRVRVVGFFGRHLRDAVRPVTGTADARRRRSARSACARR